MARYIRHISGYNQPIAKGWRVAASTTINEGDLVQLNAASKYLEPAVAASTTLVGIAQQSITTDASVTPDDEIDIIPLSGLVVRLPYIGTTKTSLTDADLATTLFDVTSAGKVSLDDTTGGMCSVVGYDNDKKTADVIFATDNVVRIG